MGGSSGSSQPTQTNVTQTNLPGYVQPYFENLLNSAQNVAGNAYTPYTGQRVADFTPAQQQGFDITQSTVGGQQPYIGAATQATNMAANTAQNTAGYQAAPITSQNFGQDAANQYMSPYMNDVVNYQKGQAQRDFAEGQAGRDSAAVQAGAFGGYRDAIQQGLAQRGLAQQLGGIEATGAQNAFTQAQAQFNADQARGLQAQTANDAAAAQAAGIQQTGAGLGLQVGSQYSNLASANQGLGLQQAQAMQGIGAQQQALQQQGLDIGYQNFQNQVNFPYQQLGFMSNILHGLPVQPNTQQATYTNPSAISQIAGLGIGGIGLSNMMKAS
jgi:hypothetical protein